MKMNRWCLVAFLFVAGAFAVVAIRPDVKAQTNSLPSVVTVGACFDLASGNQSWTTEPVEAIEGHWVRSGKKGAWINLEQYGIIRPAACPK
jgi:hypothetical protein